MTVVHHVLFYRTPGEAARNKIKKGSVIIHGGP